MILHTQEPSLFTLTSAALCPLAIKPQMLNRMKIKDEKIVDISMGISDEKTFKLDQESGILYDILRSKMYRDPISSIVREIASNSRDANREAGRADVPIKVFFTNSDDEKNYLFDNDSTAINFQDNGLGMTPDRIEDIYLTYGASDKRGTDNLTGGWGLGAIFLSPYIL